MIRMDRIVSNDNICSKRMRYKIYEAMEIPDVVGHSSNLSLKDVLESSSVRMLDWSDLTIGEMLGKGAFGVVSRGQYCGCVLLLSGDCVLSSVVVNRRHAGTLSPSKN